MEVRPGQEGLERRWWVLGEAALPWASGDGGVFRGQLHRAGRPLQGPGTLQLETPLEGARGKAFLKYCYFDTNTSRV